MLNNLLQQINVILTTEDKAARSEVEANLVAFRKSNPNELVQAFLAIMLNRSVNKPERNFVVSQLKLTLSKFCPASYTCIWEHLTPIVQKEVQIKLFEALVAETEQTLKNYIGRTLGEIAGSVLSTNDLAWPSFKQDLWILFAHNDISNSIAAFDVLSAFLDVQQDFFRKDFNELFTLFSKALTPQVNLKLKQAALDSFVSFLEIIESKKEREIIAPLVIPIYETIYEIVKATGENEALEALGQMLEVNPRIFKKTFKELVHLMTNTFHLPQKESGVQHMITEILLDYCEIYPALLRKNASGLEVLVNMIFTHMCSIDKEIPKEWMVPPEGYNEDMEDDEDFETTRFGMSAIDRLMESVGSEEAMPLLSVAISKLLASDDWRSKYSALMALSQIGEYIEDAEKVENIVVMIRSYLFHQHPMLRYAACHAIGQISDDMRPNFQNLYGDAIAPELIKLLEDPVPRVVAHSAAALTNFLEGFATEKVTPFLNELLNRLTLLFANGISLAKECSLAAISTVAQVSKQNFIPFLGGVVQIIFAFFEDQRFLTKDYKQTKGQCIETLTIIASSVGAVAFKPAADKLFQLLIRLQSSSFEQTDPQKQYILAGWQRICLVYGEELKDYLDQILPSLFALVKNVVNSEIDLQKKAVDNENVSEEAAESSLSEALKTFENEEAEIALSMLNVFIKTLGAHFKGYFEETVKLLVYVIEEHNNESVKEEACLCLPNIIHTIKKSDPETAGKTAKSFMSLLVGTIKKEFSTDTIIGELESLKEIIEELDFAFLTEEELTNFSQVVLQMLKESDRKKTETANVKNTEADIDEDDQNYIDEEIGVQEQLQVVLSEVFGVLFKTHKKLTLPLARYLIANVLNNALGPSQSENTYKFSIFMIDDMVEFLGFENLSDQWDNFGKVLMQFSSAKSCVLRQAACYGIGVYACNTPVSALNLQTINQWMNALQLAANLPKGSEKEKQYGNCRDNAIASIGKIIKAHGGVFNIVHHLLFWVETLPLRWDKPEALAQHQFLADIIISQPDWILGLDPAFRIPRLKRVVAIYGDILTNHKLFNDVIRLKMKEGFMKISQNAQFLSNSAAIWAELSPRIQKSIKDLLSN